MSDSLWTELRAQLDEREAIELVMLVGHYAMLATTLNTLRVEPDRPRPTSDSIALRRGPRAS